MTPQTTWAKPNNPYTGMVSIKEVPIPRIAKPRKGSTKYDEAFTKLLDMKSALECHESAYEILRRALTRFLKFRDLTATTSSRRQLNKQTRMVTMWLEKK